MQKPLELKQRLNFPETNRIENEELATGDGTLTDFTEIVASPPMIPGTVIVNDETETFEDDGKGNLSGSEGGSGTVDYLTGGITVSFANPVTGDESVVASYDRAFRALQTEQNEDLGEPASSGTAPGFDDRLIFGAFLANPDVIPGSFSATVNFDSSEVTISDDGDGNLSGDNVQGGSINYNTGEISITFDPAPDSGSNLTATYSHGIENKYEKMLGTDVRGVYSVEVTSKNPAESPVGLFLIKSSSLDNGSIGESISIEPGEVQFLRLSGRVNYLKVLGGGGKATLTFHKSK